MYDLLVADMVVEIRQSDAQLQKGGTMIDPQSGSESKERLIGSSKQHWAVFILPLLYIVFFIIFLVLGLRSSSILYIPFSIAFLIGGLYGLTRRAIDFFTIELFLTNKRVVTRSGLIQRRQLEWKLNQVESLNVIQTPLGRALDYGTVTIVGTGGTSQKIKSLRNPGGIRRAILKFKGDQ